MPFAASRPPTRRIVVAVLVISLAGLLGIAHEASAQSKGGKKSKGIFRWDEHPTIKLGDLTVMFRARLQADWNKTDGSTENPDAPVLDIARRRVGIEGTYGKLFEYQADFDLDHQDDRWRDLYLNYSQFGEAQFQYGKFKMPFSVDENTSPTNLDFIYRSLAASTLAPRRDHDFMAHGRCSRVFRYEVGLFDHDGRNAKPGLTSTRVTGEQTRDAPECRSVPHVQVALPISRSARPPSSDVLKAFRASGATVFGQVLRRGLLVRGRRDAGASSSAGGPARPRSSRASR